MSASQALWCFVAKYNPFFVFLKTAHVSLRVLGTDPPPPPPGRGQPLRHRAHSRYRLCVPRVLPSFVFSFQTLLDT